MSDSKVWFVTGASQGLGLILVKKLLDAGCRVAATSRNAQKLNDSIGVRDSKRFLSLSVDLNNVDSISESVQKTIDSLGTIDVVVNNAGYGMMGTVEDTDWRLSVSPGSSFPLCESRSLAILLISDPLQDL